MSPQDARLRLLRAELEREWDHVKLHQARARSVDPTDGPHPAAFVALSLDHADQAFESLMVRLERGIGLPDRGGTAWHRDLLSDAGLPIAGLRPPLYPPEAEADWAEVQGFRHFLRHAYTVELDPLRLRRLVDRLVSATAHTEPWLFRLFESLTNDGATGRTTDASPER